MTKEKQNKKIAELMGMIGCDKWEPAFHPLMGMQKHNCGHVECYPKEFGPPKFTDSLDLMKTAEDRMSDSTYRSFCQILEGFWLGQGFPRQAAISASAEKRAEAYLRVLESWEG